MPSPPPSPTAASGLKLRGSAGPGLWAQRPLIFFLKFSCPVEADKSCKISPPSPPPPPPHTPARPDGLCGAWHMPPHPSAQAPLVFSPWLHRFAVKQQLQPTFINVDPNKVKKLKKLGAGGQCMAFLVQYSGISVSKRRTLLADAQPPCAPGACGPACLQDECLHPGCGPRAEAEGHKVCGRGNGGAYRWAFVSQREHTFRCTV